jgi:hypothetical protein
MRGLHNGNVCFVGFRFVVIYFSRS